MGKEYIANKLSMIFNEGTKVKITNIYIDYNESNYLSPIYVNLIFSDNEKKEECTYNLNIEKYFEDEIYINISYFDDIKN